MIKKRRCGETKGQWRCHRFAQYGKKGCPQHERMRLDKLRRLK